MDAPLRRNESREPSVRVIAAVAEAKECDEMELPPLYESIDPDALDRLVADFPGTSVRFGYAGCGVTASGDRVDVDRGG